MCHEKFTEWAAGCLEVVLAAIEGDERRIARGVTRTHVNEMQVAARMVWGTPQVVTRAAKRAFGRVLVKTRLSKLGNDASILSTLGT
ncbi:MAG: hypothetical protein JOZ19_13470 [Rubrobacter sp.]|nr:hypothetical protein [Rubrobacter sp.]